MKRIVLPSKHPGKAREIGQILTARDVEVLAQSRYKVAEIEETGLTFVENALLKANKLIVPCFDSRLQTPDSRLAV